eukprot:2971335-Pyramimonas_sp.AAC.1
MAFAAKRAAAHARRQAVGGSLEQFRDRVASPKAPPVPDELRVDGKTLYHPIDIVDRKVLKWHALWSPQPPDLDEVNNIFRDIRDAAAVEQLKPLHPERVSMSSSLDDAQSRTWG